MPKTKEVITYMDEFLILLQAKLDEAKSQGNINADIKELQNQLDKLKVQVEIDPKTAQKLADSIGKLVNQKVVISNIGIDSNSGIKAGQEYGKQVSQGISQGMSSASKSTEKVLRDFSELNDAKRKFVDGHDLISKDDIADAERLYDTVRKAFSEFGQVTVSKDSMNDGSLENMRVKIEQVNGEMKITRDFMLYFNESKNGFRLVDDDTIRTTEKMIQHLNEEKNIVNATNEEANAIKAKLAEQEKYYKNIKNEVNNLYNLKTKLLSADELQSAELEKQIKQTKERISYNNKQIDKKDLRDNSLDRQINDLEVAKQKQLDLASAKSQDTVNTKELAQAEREATAALKERQAIEAQVNKIQLSMDTGGYESKVESLIAKTRQWTDGNGNARISTDALSTALRNLGDASTALSNSNTVENQKALIAAEKELDTQIKKVTNSVRTMNADLTKDSAVASIQNRVSEFMSKNGKAVKWSGDFKRIFNELSQDAGLTKQRVAELTQEFNNAVASARNAGKLGKTFFQTLREGMSSFSYWTSSTFLVMKAIQSVKGGLDTVKALDDALIDLTKTTTTTNQQLEDFYYKANKIAKQLGATTQEVIQATADWSRLGYSIKEAMSLAETTTILKSISPGMSMDTATETIVSTIKAYGIEAEDALDGVASKINIIGNNLALSNNDISEILKRSASAMNAANTSLEKTISLGAAAQAIVQDSAVVGTALKSVSTRIRGIDEETQQLSDDLVNIKSDIYDLTNQKVRIMIDNDTYKDIYTILDEISQVWDELSDKQHADLLSKLFGTRQTNVGAAILSNFDDARKAMDLMSDSAGNAMKEMDVIYSSMDYKLGKLRETSTSVAQNLFKRSDMKTVVDSLTSVMNVIDSLTSKLGLFGSIGLGAGIFAGWKNVGELKIREFYLLMFC